MVVGSSITLVITLIVISLVVAQHDESSSNLPRVASLRERASFLTSSALHYALIPKNSRSTRRERRIQQSAPILI